LTCVVHRHDSEEDHRRRENQRRGNRELTQTSRRIAGLLYLVVAIFGGFAQGFVYPKVYAAGDAATKAKNFLANFGLVRIGVVADLIQVRSGSLSR